MMVTRYAIALAFSLLMALGCSEATNADVDDGNGAAGALYDCDDGQIENPETDSQARENENRAGRAELVASSSNEAFPEHLAVEETATVVTADFVNHSISVLDLHKLLDPGACRDSALLREISFGDDIPPAFAVEITPDGKRAVIAASAEWLLLAPLLAGPETADALQEIPPQAEGGMVLIVDLETGDVLAELPNSGPPMLISVTPDGSLAFTANASAGTMTVVDLEALEIIEEVDSGAGAEAVAISPDGKYGIVNQATAGTIRMFETADPSGTLSEPVNIGNDTSDIAWIEGRPDRVVVSLSFKNDQGGDYVVLDVSDPQLPAVVERGPDISGLGVLASVPFVVTPVPGTSSMILSAAENMFSETRISRVDFSTEPSRLEWTVTVPARGITMGIAVDPTGRVGLAGIIGERELLKINLDDGALESMVWLEQLGPSYVDIR